ncbi:MAG TPA: hypothetical protein ENK28_01775 [Aliiroseovarius sp.]|nr:hypothetical protein [Aliiroseovarius sp.]
MKTPNQWKEKARELAQLYFENKELARRELRNHRYFIHVPDHNIGWVSGHEVLRGLTKGYMGSTPRSGQNHKNLRNQLREADFEEIEQGNANFDECWDSYVTLCKSFGVKPSGGEKKKPKDRTFFRRREQPEIPKAFDQIPSGKEGASIQITSNRYERDPKLRSACIKHYIEKDGCLACQVCGMDFENRYGEIGRDFIHIHHVDPLGDGQGKRAVDPVRDLVPICPNCHAMLHKKPGKGAYSIEEVKEMMEQQRTNPQA